MEYLATEIGTNPENRVGEGDNVGQLVSALPTTLSVEIVRENPPNDNDEAIGAEASESDLIVDLVQGIESLTKADARARLLELEEDQEKTFLQIGGILSAIQKNKWFDPHASLDEWVKNNTGIKRSKPRALIQIYDVIVKSGVTWAEVQHLGWTKLNALAGVLNESNDCQSASNFDPRSASKTDPVGEGLQRQWSPRRSWSGLRSRGERGSGRSGLLGIRRGF